MYAYGVVGPQEGDAFYLTMPAMNTACMKAFIEELVAYYPELWLKVVYGKKVKAAYPVIIDD